MTNHKPYEKRNTFPLFFYPMFHPEKHMISKTEIDSFQKKLENKCHYSTKDELYIQIPFCDSFCYMCPVYKMRTPRNKQIMIDYINMIKKEMAAYANTPYVQSLNIECVYFGGGTPTTLPATMIEELISYTKECFSIKPEAQITYEGDVRTLKDKDRLRALRRAGCARTSFGVQTFDSLSRRLTGLVPTVEEIKECIRSLQEFGYKINLDLMFGLPGQSFDTWKKDLETAVGFGAEGIEIYETVLYPHGKLFKFRHKIEMADDDCRLKMIEYANHFLNKNGFTQKSKVTYEKPGNDFRFFSIGQEFDNTIAIGDNAIGYLNHFTYRNLSPLNQYLDRHNDRLFPIRLGFELSQEEIYVKGISNLIRQLRINKTNFKNEIGYFKRILDSLKQRNLIEEDETEIRLTPLGRLWCDNIFLEFIPAEQKYRSWKIIY